MGSNEASKSKEELQENSSTAFVNCLYLQSRIKFSASRHSRNKAIAEKQTSKFKASQSVGFAAAVSPHAHNTPLHTLQTCKQSTQVTVQYLHTLYSSANRPIRLVGRVLSTFQDLEFHNLLIQIKMGPPWSLKFPKCSKCNKCSDLYCIRDKHTKNLRPLVERGES